MGGAERRRGRPQDPADGIVGRLSVGCKNLRRRFRENRGRDRRHRREGARRIWQAVGRERQGGDRLNRARGEGNGGRRSRCRGDRAHQQGCADRKWFRISRTHGVSGIAHGRQAGRDDAGGRRAAPKSANCAADNPCRAEGCVSADHARGNCGNRRNGLARAEAGFRLRPPAASSCRIEPARGRRWHHRPRGGAGHRAGLRGASGEGAHRSWPTAARHHVP